ncbi:hypothetical protein AHiyo6_00320 [Arthrobacter sp. Hiyo6]|nr:hypothetical protein AHiyo6_00320 [Arthrobacter sp. Hiyo6]
MWGNLLAGLIVLGEINAGRTSPSHRPYGILKGTTMTITEQPTPPKTGLGRTKLLIIIGGAIVVLLVIIAVAVSSQAIRSGQEADAKVSASASASAMMAALDAAQKVIDDQRAADAVDANAVCEKRLIQKHPTATVQAGKTKSTYRASDNSYDTTGGYTDAPAGNTIPMQFVCSSTKGSGTSWSVFLKNDGHGSLVP